MLVLTLDVASLSDDKGQLLFQAPSPPAWNDGIKLDTSPPSSPLSPLAKAPNDSPKPLPQRRPSPLLDAVSPRSNSSVGTDRFVRPYVSKIGVLPSSLPAYHRDFMEAQRSGRSLASTLSTAHSEDHEPHPQTDAEKVETARRLNPHSRSQLKLDEANNRPVGMTPVPQKKAKPTKWQFGIRSRNQPLEAIGCIYRALAKLGGEWVVDEDWEPHLDPQGDERHGPQSSKLLQVANDTRNPDGSFVSNAGSGGSLHHSVSMSKNASTTSIDPNAHYKLPADPWMLRVRLKKDGMYPPGIIPPGSTHSSSIDLRRQSIASLSSASGSMPSQEFSSPPQTFRPDGKPRNSVIMHLDIQLYEMEPGVYLVDFKCAGYETADGMLLEEKDVTSPYPFLDLASKLIIQLAEAD